MKIVKCPICKREHEVEDNVIISICPICSVEMQEVKEKENVQKRVE